MRFISDRTVALGISVGLVGANRIGCLVTYNNDDTCLTAGDRAPAKNVQYYILSAYPSLDTSSNTIVLYERRANMNRLFKIKIIIDERPDF